MALGVRGRRYLLPILIAGATVAGFVLVARNTAGEAVSAATSPNWALLAVAFAIGAVVQPLRALACKACASPAGCRITSGRGCCGG